MNAREVENFLEDTEELAYNVQGRARGLFHNVPRYVVPDELIDELTANVTRANQYKQQLVQYVLETAQLSDRHYDVLRRLNRYIDISTRALTEANERRANRNVPAISPPRTRPTPPTLTMEPDYQFTADAEEPIIRVARELHEDPHDVLAFMHPLDPQIVAARRLLPNPRRYAQNAAARNIWL